MHQDFDASGLFRHQHISGIKEVAEEKIMCYICSQLYHYVAPEVALHASNMLDHVQDP
jgi:hypothetical protein